VVEIYTMEKRWRCNSIRDSKERERKREGGEREEAEETKKRESLCGLRSFSPHQKLH
jgi:hypothetical protein